MNYIEQINNFWAYTEDKDISSIDIAVYFSLLKYCNSLNWLNPFICHWDIVCQVSKVSKNAYYKSLERLEKEGLITYTKGKQNSPVKPKVFILKLKNRKGTIKEQQGNNEGTTREQQGNLDKHINKQTIETNKQELFETFWNMYDKKVDKTKTFKKFKTLDESVCNKIMDCLPSYIKKTPDVKYRKNPLTWLNGECWNDEISAPPPPKVKTIEWLRSQVSKKDGITKYQPVNRYENTQPEKVTYIQTCKMHGFEMEDFWHDGSKLEKTW